MRMRFWALALLWLLAEALRLRLETPGVTAGPPVPAAAPVAAAGG
eukprot:CAMPEP_0202383908 /NCGR_PEP_ID=MMETSP1127-20130417/52047_1 /ASSEMBLY_ACC=CAM_ASM_000462 /TAXON_ID=3047 /ORGANISM="Dunaliella tertiolecta, Strain CCMP1320" /LENGTH=44 /DNA_ID= /DNA_START= /DNA_END= /DNA_ORIENTATION=